MTNDSVKTDKEGRVRLLPADASTATMTTTRQVVKEAGQQEYDDTMGGYIEDALALAKNRIRRLSRSRAGSAILKDKVKQWAKRPVAHISRDGQIFCHDGWNKGDWLSDLSLIEFVLWNEMSQERSKGERLSA